MSSPINNDNQLIHWSSPACKCTLITGLPIAATVAIVAAVILFAPVAAPALAFVSVKVLLGSAIGLAVATVALAAIFGLINLAKSTKGTAPEGAPAPALEGALY